MWDYCAQLFLTCWGSEPASAPPLRWHRGWFGPRCKCRGWCSSLLAPATRQTPCINRAERSAVVTVSLAERSQTSAIILWKMLQRRMVWKTLAEIPWVMHCRLFFTKVLPCRATSVCTDETEGYIDKWMDGWTDWYTHLCVEGSSCVEEEFTDFMHPVRVTGGVFQTGEESTTHSHGFVQTSGHVSCEHTQDDMHKHIIVTTTHHRSGEEMQLMWRLLNIKLIRWEIFLYQSKGLSISSNTDYIFGPFKAMKKKKKKHEDCFWKAATVQKLKSTYTRTEWLK